jgi:IgA Peptidase M64
MTRADGQVIGTAQIHTGGPRHIACNLVILSEGYQAGQLNQFAADAQTFVNTFLSIRPINEAPNAFNIFRIDVSSTDSGADNPKTADCPEGTGAAARTFFDATFCNKGIHRALMVDNTTAWDVAKAQVPETRYILVIVNSPIWGGTGATGAPAVSSNATNDWAIVATHELGHSKVGLADEYEFRVRGCKDAMGNHLMEPTQELYQGSEPSQPNITTQTNRNLMKWGPISPTTPMPTTKKNCRLQILRHTGQPCPTRNDRSFRGRWPVSLRFVPCRVHMHHATAVTRGALLRRLPSSLAPFAGTLHASSYGPIRTPSRRPGSSSSKSVDRPGRGKDAGAAPKSGPREGPYNEAN